MPVVALIGAAVGVGTSVAGAVVKANAGASGAEAAGGIASAQQKQAAADRAAATQFAMPTAQELQQIGDRIQSQQRYQSVQEASLDRDQKILSTLDPALITAGQQANQMMQGKEAAILSPMKQQQDFQRKQMQSRLAAQFGPGYASSSVGQQAMQQFDMQSNLQMQQAQMQSFQQVSQFLGFGMQQRTALQNEERLSFETGSNMSAQTLRSMSGIQERQENAVLGTSKEMVGTAGAEYAKQAADARAMSGIGDSIAGIGGAAAGAISGFGAMAGAGGGSAPTSGGNFGSGFQQSSGNLGGYFGGKYKMGGGR